LCKSHNKEKYCIAATKLNAPESIKKKHKLCSKDAEMGQKGDRWAQWLTSLTPATWEVRDKKDHSWRLPLLQTLPEKQLKQKGLK
jgi:hypothetical protein